MKDQVTSIEQSRRLLDLGVPAEKASMVYVNDAKLPSFREELDLVDLVECGHEYIPAFRVEDLLEKVLPNVIRGTHNTYELTLQAMVGGGWRFYYSAALTELEADNIGEELGDNLINLLCSRIEWLLSNGYGLKV